MKEDMEQQRRLRQHRRQRRNDNTVFLVLTVVFGITTLLAVFVCVMLVSYYNIKSTKQESVETIEVSATVAETSYSEDEMQEVVAKAVDEAEKDTKETLLSTIKEQMMSGDGTVAMLRSLYPDQIVFLNANQYYFFDISEKLAKNNYQTDQFILDENNIMTYLENGQVVSHKGIDVSKYQGKIDWNAVAADGVEYAIIRVGIRGYSEGKLIEDECFKANMEGATAAGIKIGVYFFTQATSDEEAVEEANYTLDMIKDYSIDYPVYLDVEDIKASSARTSTLTPEQRTQYAKTFLETVQAAGYTPAIYGNIKTFLLMLDMEQLEQYDKWYAYYNTPVYFPYNYNMLQYSEKGKVAGISTEVDVNICMKDYTVE